MTEAEYDKHIERLAELLALYGFYATTCDAGLKKRYQEVCAALTVAFRLLRKERIAKYMQRHIDKYEQ